MRASRFNKKEEITKGENKRGYSEKTMDTGRPKAPPMGPEHREREVAKVGQNEPRRGSYSHAMFAPTTRDGWKKGRTERGEKGEVGPGQEGPWRRKRKQTNRV